MNGYKLNSELVEKAIAYYQNVGRKVDKEAARVIGREMIASGEGYEWAGDAIDAFKTRIWNAGLVR